jgi:hypothetical protein
MKFNIIGSVFILFVIAGCQHVQTVTKVELEKAQTHWQEPKVTAWYYMGTKEEFDYFIHIDLGKDTIYRVTSSEIQIENPLSYSLKRKEWRLMPWGFEAIVRKQQESNELLQLEQGERR